MKKKLLFENGKDKGFEDFSINDDETNDKDDENLNKGSFNAAMLK
jgi:hypothetical protein